MGDILIYLNLTSGDSQNNGNMVFTKTAAFECKLCKTSNKEGTVRCTGCGALGPARNVFACSSILLGALKALNYFCVRSLFQDCFDPPVEIQTAETEFSLYEQ
eukprot:g10331.t1